jgi:hypothetical protein
VTENAIRRKIILNLSRGEDGRLERLVEEWIAHRVVWAAVVGSRSDYIEDLIDALVVADGSDPSRFMMTTSHREETLEAVVEFMNSLTEEFEGSSQVINL